MLMVFAGIQHNQRNLSHHLQGETWKKNEYEWTKWNVNMEHIWIRLGKGYVFGMYVKKKMK